MLQLKGLWIAFKNYYLRDTTQRSNNTFSSSTVVNCFQKLLSSWHDTTNGIFGVLYAQLWIAFKNYYLRDTTQRCICFRPLCHSCELLSKIIIFVTRHNLSYYLTKYISVVNCFQKLLSSWHDTTNGIFGVLYAQLWIAFKNYYLRDTTQHESKSKQETLGCELLSKIIIFVTRHNWKSKKIIRIKVVNCFQKLLSSWHDTTTDTDITIP